MPDFWEKTTGTDVGKPDAMIILPDGCAAIERYVNWLGDYHAVTSSGKVIGIELLNYTSGFSQGTPVSEMQQFNSSKEECG